MRLLCEYNDGTTVSLPAALQKNALEIRGLVTDAFFQCLAALPDTGAFLRAEHSVRDSLASFEGSQDRYVKSYVVTRRLDARTKATPRASIIQSSFLTGGPLALIGIFHATSDASRNPRSRETLHYLLSSSEESRDELFNRASTFPSHPSTSLWFRRIIDKLDIDAQSLAYLLVSLGSHPGGIPADLFTRIRQPSYTWDKDGEIVMLNSDIEPYLKDESKFSSALHVLKSIGLLKQASGIHVDNQVAALMGENLTPWRGRAAKVVCHAFPKHQAIEPDSYAEQCEMLLPLLQHVLSYPFEGIAHLRTTFLRQAVEACLSSLNFGDLDWKKQVLSHAERMLSLFAGREPIEFETLRARVAVNKACTMQLYQNDMVTEELDIVFPRCDHRSNAFAAEFAILKAQVQIDLNNFEQALQETLAFNPIFDGSTSPLARFMDDRLRLVRGTIFRFDGRFSEAYETLHSLPPSPDTIYHLSAVLCEQGECDMAIRRLAGQLQLVTEPKPQELQLAWAHAHLFKCMQAAKYGRQDRTSLQVATDAYLSIRGIQLELDAFSISVGQAILLHLQGKLDAAKSAWLVAFGTLQSCRLAPGYVDVLLIYSMSELAFQRHGTVESRMQRNEVALMLARHRRSHRFLGLGSLWPDILNS